MEPVPLGTSDIHVSRVILGAWAMGGWFWGGSDDEEAVDAIRASVDAGIHAIDTAPVYGFGHSERVVGRAIADIRDRVVVMTKVGLRWDDTAGSPFFDTEGPDGTPVHIFRNLQPESILEEVRQSLDRLGVDRIDLLQCHWPDPSTPIDETMGCLADLVGQGVVGAVGVSNFDTDQLQQAQTALGALPLASNQPPYSLLKRKIEADVLPWCRTHNVGTVVYSPMERGLLTGRVTPQRVFPADDGRSTDPMFQTINRLRVIEALESARDIANQHQATFAQLAIAWCLHQPGVTAAIVGARTPEQAVENAAARAISLSTHEVDRLTQRFTAVEIDRKRAPTNP